MKVFILIFIVVFHSMLGFSQDKNSASNIDAQLSNSEAVVEANINQLEAYQENPEDSTDHFLFLLAAPSAVAAVTDFVVLAGAAGYISYQLQSSTLLSLDTINVNVLSMSEVIRSLKDIFATIKQAISTTRIAEERLRAAGYTDDDLARLVGEIERKSQMCSNKENNKSPDHFCPEYKNNFARDGYSIEKKKRGWMVKLKGRDQCCLEWDDLHCGFEIFDKKGKHKGEVGCLEDEFDPCQANLNRGAHAKPQPANHKPRTPLCNK